MSTGSTAHNASTIALTRAAASSPPSGNHMARDSTERYATNADSRGRKTPPSPKRLGAVPDRMRAADGQNTGGQRELRQSQRDGWKAGWSSLVFFAGATCDALADASEPPEGAASWDGGGLDVCCWRCVVDALAVESGWVASLSLVLSTGACFSSS